MSTPRRPFAKYPNKFFVESGTYFGGGIIDALNCKFEQIISFEVQPMAIINARKYFKECKNVEIIAGSSARLMYDRIKDIKEPITFWLDGHYSLGDTGFDPDYISPLLKELEQIAKHDIKTHTILIDDRRLLVKSSDGGLDGKFDISEADVLTAIMKINPKYKIKYEDGHVKDDIIVAYIPTGSVGSVGPK